MHHRASASAEHNTAQSGIISAWLRPPDLLSSLSPVSPDAALTGDLPSSFPRDFINFLKLAQNMELDFIPVIWQPSLPRLCFGGTAELSQSYISLQASPTFKRVNQDKRDNKFSGCADGTLKIVMAEMWTWSISQIRDHPNVVRIEGIYWELDSSAGCLWPVLVIEKAERRVFNEFFESQSWERHQHRG